MSATARSQVSIGDFLTRSYEWVEPEPEQIYKRITARLWGKGLTLRAKVPGSTIAAARQLCARSGQFLVSRIDARHGAFGIVPDELGGALVSNDFPCFDIDARLVIPRYFEWYSRTSAFVDLCRRASEGSTNRVRLKEDELLKMQIPLPSLDEQWRIVARLDRVALLVEKAQRSLEQLDGEAVLLTQSLHAHLSSEQGRTFGELIELWEDKETVEAETSYPQVGIKGFGGGLFSKASVRGSETSYRAFNRLHEGLLVVSQPKGWEGAVAICDQALAGWFVSPEYRTFRCREGQLLPHYLNMLIRTPWFQTQLTKLTRGQGARRERLRPEMLLMMETKMPSVGAQAKAIRIADRCNSLRTLREMTAVDLNAFVPAMLREDFGGEGLATP